MRRVMSGVKVPRIVSVSAGHGDTGGENPNHPPAPAQEDQAPIPEWMDRLRALIEEVTNQLGGAAPGDRQACRSDAIDLLLAAIKELAVPLEIGESPLMYLLLEEQQKAATLLAKASPNVQLLLKA
jgi:hypothetical protein